MNARCVAVADQDLQSRACEPAGERTVYLRRQAQRWGVSIDEALLLSTIDDDEAFHCACDARRFERGEPLRLLILSGPSAAAYEWAVVNPNQAQAAAKPTLGDAVVRHDCKGCAAPEHCGGAT